MLRHRLLAVFLALGLLLPLAAVERSRGALGASPPAFANSQFEQTWSRADLPVARGDVSRSWLWGPQPGLVRAEPFTGAPGGTRTVQYFDKARMEAGGDASGQWATTTGLLVVELVSGRMQTGPGSYENRAPAALPVAGDSATTQDPAVPLYSSFRDVASLPNGPDRRVASAQGAAVTATINRAGTVGTQPRSDVRYSAYAPETGHNIPDVFDRFMQSRGLVSENGAVGQGQLMDPVYVLGYPLSEAFWATVPIGGKPVQVLLQLYQRRVLTYIPSFTPEWQVQMGNVGQHYYAWRYGSAPAQAATPSPTPGAVGAGDTFVHIAGNQLFYAGKAVNLKGTNYWMRAHPFIGTWTDWNGAVVRQELDKARELGVNTIRISLPYDHAFATRVVWGEGCGEKGVECDQVKGFVTNEMTQLLQIASGYGMKVLFALYDWADDYPLPGTAGYQKQMNYLQGIVGPFIEDDRVLGWDLHNEPENYDTWKTPGGPGVVITWAANVTAALHALDKRHPVTIGMGQYQNLWAQPAGRTLIDIVDFVSFHCYDAGGLRTQINAVQAHTGKPILLEEMGWPSGPAELSRANAIYDEATQQFLYKIMLGDAKASTLVGVVQWTLEDNPLGTSDHYIAPTVESWFGLVRRDGSFKPAAADFRDSYPAPLLASRTTTNLPLTKSDGSPAQ